MSHQARKPRWGEFLRIAHKASDDAHAGRVGVIVGVPLYPVVADGQVRRRR